MAVVALRQFGASRRARAELARDNEYRVIAERTLTAQEATESRLAELNSRLTDIDLRVATMERVLKDAE